MLKSDRCTIHYDFNVNVLCACVDAPLYLYLLNPEDSYASVLLFFPFFFLSFLLRLKEQQAVTAPWALTDHSLQSGCQRCRLGSATLHKGAVGAVQRVSEIAVLC